MEGKDIMEKLNELCVLIFTTEELKAHPIRVLCKEKLCYSEVSIDIPRTNHQDKTVSKILRELQQMIFFIFFFLIICSLNQT